MRQPAIDQIETFLRAARGQNPLVMGILNVTPDSFSDGGLFDAVPAAAARARAMVRDGAAVVDIGGESTRPGFTPVPEAVEIGRVMPVLEALDGSLGVPISVDTTKAAVARRALSSGASIINDIWGFQGDPALPEAVAQHRAGAILMHNRAQADPAVDIVEDMLRFFERALAIAESAGVARERLVLDPGIGFGKTPSQQIDAVRGIARLRTFGLPILAGLSRKSFLGRITGAGPGARTVETLAANLCAASFGATIFRVHDVAEHVAAFAVRAAIEGARVPERAAPSSTP